MMAQTAERIENATGFVAAASLAAAMGFAGFNLAAAFTNMVGTTTVAAVAAIIGFVAGSALVRAAGGDDRAFPQPSFDVVKVEVVGAEELLLTESDRLKRAGEPPPLELDDVLVKIGQDSRVVQLFDRSAMPTPGQLKARIDRHLDGGTSHSPSPDASEALFAALADLRRSLR